MRLRCLIVDDNASFGHAARELLEEQGISVVGLAGSSDEAVRRVEDLRPDVVLVDVKLGTESGFELARRLADHGRHPGMSVILISTIDADEFIDLVEASPAVGFIAKTDLSGDAIHRLVTSSGDGGAS